MWVIKIRGNKVGKMLKYDPADDIAIRNKIYQKYARISMGTLEWTDIEIVEEE